MRLLVFGGRNYGLVPRGTVKYTPAWARAAKQATADRDLLHRRLDALLPDVSILIHGDASGADRVARGWAQRRRIPDLPFPANWYPNGREGGLDRGAGPKRNQQMLDEGRPDKAVGFPGGSGTADMAARCRAAGIELVEIVRPAEKIVQVTAPEPRGFCAAIVFIDDICTDAAPILKWCLGKSADNLRAQFRDKGWKAIIVPKLPEGGTADV